MENYKLQLTGFIKSKYSEMNREIMDKESKLRDMVNDGRYNQSYLQRALREMNNSIKELNTNTRKEIQGHLAFEKQVLEEQRKALLNNSVEPHLRLANIMMAQLGGYEVAIERSIELGDISTATTLLGLCNGNDKISADKYIELDTKLYELTKDKDIKHIEYLQERLGYHESKDGVISDIEVDIEGNVTGYTPYTYNNTIDNYIDTTASLF